MGGGRAAPGQHRRDEDRRGQDAHRRAARLPERAGRQGRARRHGQRLPGQARLGVDGPGAPLPRPRGRRDPGRDDAGRAAEGSTRPTSPTARTTSSASTTCATTWPGAWRSACSAATTYAIVDEVDSILIDEARTPLIICGPGRAEHPLVHRVRQDRAPAAARRGRRGRLRGRREEADRRHPGVGRREGRGLARHRQPVRLGQHAAGQLPQQRDQGQGAVQEGQGLRRDERRGPDRGRVHRPHPARPPVQRGHAPGHRGQGRRADQGREPDPRHDHAAELLPALRQARRHDRHGDDRGQRVPSDLQARRGPDPHQHADDPRRPVRRGLPDRAGQVRGGGRGHRRAARGRPAGAGRHHQRGEVRARCP